MSALKLTLTLPAQSGSEIAATRFSNRRASWQATLKLRHGERLSMLMRLLRLKLGLGYRKTGIYKAVAEAARAGTQSFLIVLTDLQVDSEALLDEPQAGRTIVVQIGAPWRLSLGLNEAYYDYQRNCLILERLRLRGLAAFDLRPEELIDPISQYINKRAGLGDFRHRIDLVR